MHFPCKVVHNPISPSPVCCNMIILPRFVCGCTVWDSCSYSKAFSVAHSTERCHMLRRYAEILGLGCLSRAKPQEVRQDIIWDTTFQSELQNSLINLIIIWDDLSYLTPIESAQTYPTIVIQSSNYRGITQAPAAALDNSKIGFEVSDGSPLPKALGWISSRQEPMSLMSLSTGFILRSDFQKKQFRVAGWNASLITVEIIFPAVWWSNPFSGVWTVWPFERHGRGARQKQQSHWDYRSG